MITFITHADKRPDFIELQYESIQKHIKNDFEYVVLNNDITKGENYKKIKEICQSLSIRCVDVTLDENLQYTNGVLNYSNNNYTTGNNACVYSLFWTFNNFITNEEIVSIIDSDMFFIEDVDIENLISDRDIIFTPHYRALNNNHISYIWPGFVCLNLKKSPHLKTLNWNHSLQSGILNGIVGDVGTYTYFDILNFGLNDNPIYVYEHAIYDDIKTDSSNNKLIHYQLNGCVNYMLKLNDSNHFLSSSHIGGWKISQDKSFPHEPTQENYWDNVTQKITKILSIFEKNNSEFPSPLRVSFLEMNNTFFILHYQGGSNYSTHSTTDYNSRKTSAVKKILTNSISELKKKH